MIFVLIGVLYAAVYWGDYRMHLHKKKDKVFYLKTVMILLSLSVTMLTELQVPLPSPILPITYLLRNVLKLG